MAFFSAAKVVLGAAVFVAGVVAMPACLPAGAPPTGRHVLSGRDQDNVIFVPGPTGEPSRILLSRRLADEADPFDISLIWSTIDDSDGGGLLSSARVLLDHVAAGGAGCGSAPCDPPVDGLGFLYLVRETSGQSAQETVRVDPPSGARVSLGEINQLRFSADRTRVAFRTNTDLGPTWTVTDPIQGESTISAKALEFVDNDIFYLSAEGQLTRLPETNPRESVLDGINSFNVVATTRGPLLIVVPSASPTTHLLFDVTTSVETALPAATAAASSVLPSPSGRYLASQAYAPFSADQLVAYTFTLFDRDTGHEMTEGPFADSVNVIPVWRPDHEELWLHTIHDVWTLRPEQTPVKFASWEGSLPVMLSLSGNLFFTADGRYWLRTGPWNGDQTAVYLQSADDADAQPLLLNPDGTALSALWPVDGGRLLVEDSISDRKRNDIYLVDPDARTAVPLASGGNVVAIGSGRFLALLHWVVSGFGDLTLIDFTTGTQTLLAENVRAVAVDSAVSPDDPLAAGTRVAYLVSNRIASPFDGLWMTTLP